MNVTESEGQIAVPNRMIFRKSSKGGRGGSVYRTGQGTKTGELSERFQMAVDPPLPSPISGNHVHAFHTIWPLYLLAYIRPYPSKHLKGQL